MQTRMNLTDECLTELNICKISFSSKDNGELYSSFLIGQDLQEDILTAICDRSNTWTGLLLNMERPRNSSGCLENEDLENDDRRPKNEDSGKRR